MNWLKNIWADIKWLWNRPKQVNWHSELMKLEAKVVPVVEAEIATYKKGAVMNWLSIILNLVPYVVAGVQALHPTEPGTTKKQIATNLINIAAAGAIQSGALSPQNAQIAAVTAQAVSAVIDATVQAAKVSGAANFTPSKTDPAPTVATVAPTI